MQPYINSCNKLHDDAAKLLILGRRHQIKERWPREFGQQRTRIAGYAISHRFGPYFGIAVCRVHGTGREYNQRACRGKQHSIGENISHFARSVSRFHSGTGAAICHHIIKRSDKQYQIVETVHGEMRHDIIMNDR